ncbi:hypothetical protein F975_01579 [Acinetobacter sp. ANC 3789]|uniref:2Fe-2S iron-sulfur cluster-binding protein n=1 Tax=Acinetobacter sp. ANC 3789 TaxID=1217714 RepID=UPI0002CE4429|nr:2Fe-2S iron-sulfur cluster-binding protein [Acinetobacter sp. ANC 3789]ENU80525.1 hypothetical protein F975_01579 [Acinetobacter sp. ANC 3789]
MHLIRLHSSDEQFHCHSGLSLLDGMKSLARKGIPVGCRGGGCGICRVQVLQGNYQCKRMSREQVSELEQQTGIALACRIYPKSDLDVTFLGLKNSKKNGNTQ